jgi:hypothetical protein
MVKYLSFRNSSFVGLKDTFLMEIVDSESKGLGFTIQFMDE